MRHTHATPLLEAGVGLRVVADRPWRSATSFTLSTYGHVLAGRDQEAAAKLEAARKGTLERRGSLD